MRIAGDVGNGFLAAAKPVPVWRAGRARRVGTRCRLDVRLPSRARACRAGCWRSRSVGTGAVRCLHSISHRQPPEDGPHGFRMKPVGGYTGHVGFPNSVGDSCGFDLRYGLWLSICSRNTGSKCEALVVS